MKQIDFTDSQEQNWERVSEGVERIFLRSKPGENRVLIKIGAGRAYPHHDHVSPDEVFVVDGIYVDPGVENGKEFGSGSYLYYPVGTEHHATSPSGCTILVWNAGTPQQ
jgi:anti-sigma factor ChrR (cupin superfamily)